MHTDAVHVPHSLYNIGTLCIILGLHICCMYVYGVHGVHTCTCILYVATYTYMYILYNTAGLRMSVIFTAKSFRQGR